MSADRRRGVTLIELLVVTAILGILAAMVSSAALYALRESKQKTSMAQLQEIGKALEMYYVDHGDYPPVGESDIPISILSSYLVPTYMISMPDTDPWGNPYRYSRVVPSPSSSYHKAIPGTNLNSDYFLLCGGMDGCVGPGMKEMFPGIAERNPAEKYDKDIVISRSTFILLP